MRRSVADPIATARIPTPTARHAAPDSPEHQIGGSCSRRSTAITRSRGRALPNHGRSRRLRVHRSVAVKHMGTPCRDARSAAAYAGNDLPAEKRARAAVVIAAPRRAGMRAAEARQEGAHGACDGGQRAPSALGGCRCNSGRKVDQDSKHGFHFSDVIPGARMSTWISSGGITSPCCGLATWRERGVGAGMASRAAAWPCPARSSRASGVHQARSAGSSPSAV